MKTNKAIHSFQNLSCVITYSTDQVDFIKSLIPLNKEDWDEGLNVTGRPRGTLKLRDALKVYIKVKLQSIQSPHCIYCGLHEKIVGNLQRDHIAPKGFYPDFMFEAENLVLACAGCNGFLKKSNYDTLSRYNKNYNSCRFKIIHPYRDDYSDHLNFIFKDNSLIIKHKKFSRKGKTTISLFGLNEPMQASLRGASIMQSSIVLTPNQELEIQKIIKRDYSI